MPSSSSRLILPDVHFPFHDAPLLEAWLEFASDLAPDGVDIIGDLMDFFSISRFDKDPVRKTHLQDEINMARDFLADLRSVLPHADVRMTEGNHETRLKTYLWGRAKELAGLRGLSVPEVLGLSDLGIHYYPPDSPYMLNNIWMVHGDVARKANWSMSYGGSGAQAVCKRVGGNVLMGHTHQMAHVSYRTWGQLLEGYEVGCVCQFDMDYIVGIPQWQQGWAVLNLLGTDDHCVEFIRCVDHGTYRKLIFRGEVLGKLPPAKKHVHVTPRVLVSCADHTPLSRPATPLGRQATDTPRRKRGTRAGAKRKQAPASGRRTKGSRKGKRGSPARRSRPV